MIDPDDRPSVEDLVKLVVTRNGVPFEDQAEGLRKFKQACQQWQVSISYQEIATLLSWHWKMMEEAAARRAYDTAGFHKRRHEELHAVLAPLGEKESASKSGEES